MKSYIVQNRNVIAQTKACFVSGAEVRFSSVAVEEALNASRERNLVNAATAKISNAKWAADAFLRQAEAQQVAEEINFRDFLII